MKNKEIDQLLNDHVIVIYDGVCGFCDTSIQFILKQKPTDKLRFVSFQSDLGKEIRTQLNINDDLDSIIFVEGDHYYKKSKAIFKIFGHVQSNWRHMKYLRFIPSPISDFVYSIIAKYRYRIQQNSCSILSIEERKLFI